MEILNFDVLGVICQEMDFETLFSFSVTSKTMKSISCPIIEKNFPLYTLRDGTTIPREDYYKFIHSDDAERKLAFSISASGPVGLVKCNMLPPFRFLLLLARSYLKTHKSVTLVCDGEELKWLVDEAEAVFGKVRLTKNRIWTTKEICNRSKKNKTPTTRSGKIYLCERFRSRGQSYDYANGLKIGYMGEGLVSVKQYGVVKENKCATVDFGIPRPNFLKSVAELPSNVGPVNIFIVGNSDGFWANSIKPLNFKKVSPIEFKKRVEKGGTGLMAVGRGADVNHNFNCEKPPIVIAKGYWDLPARLLISLRNKTVHVITLNGDTNEPSKQWWEEM